MLEEQEHDDHVDAWFARGASGLTNVELVRAFEAAFAAVWRRAHQTLGDVTLTAIVDRVIYVAAEQHPAFAGIKLEPAGMACDALRARAAIVSSAEVAGGVRFVLVELLTVLGNLTADILTPALHAELSKIDPSDSSESGARARQPVRDSTS